MKDYIEFKLEVYPRLYKNEADVLHHLFCVLGNGIELDNKGYLGNYKCDEEYEFKNPIPLKYIYPWENNEKFQPFRKYVGCRDKGFKKSVEYFIECIKATSEDVEDISKWKENINILKETLLDSPTIEDEYISIDEGYSKFLNKIKDTTTTNGKDIGSDSVYKKWYFDVQWSDCPEFVEDEVKYIWKDYELGNDKYIHKVRLDEELFDEYPNIYYWLKHKGVGEDEEVVIHWWW